MREKTGDRSTDEPSLSCFLNAQSVKQKGWSSSEPNGFHENQHKSGSLTSNRKDTKLLEIQTISSRDEIGGMIRLEIPLKTSQKKNQSHDGLKETLQRAWKMIMKPVERMCPTRTLQTPSMEMPKGIALVFLLSFLA